MYTIVKAVTLMRTIGAQWTVTDLSRTKLEDIYIGYARAVAELSHPALTDHVYVDLKSLRKLEVDTSLTLTDVLKALGDTTLEYVDALPSTTVKYVKYADATQTGFKIATCKIGQNFPINAPATILTDLVVSRPSIMTDMSLLDTHCLLTVNGYIHNTGTDGKYAYVVDGGSSLLKSRCNQLGIWSFTDLGKLTKHKLSVDKIRPYVADGALKDKIYFDIEEDIGNKAYMLVLGGYLVLPAERVFWKRGDKSFALNLNMLNYPERIYESDKYIELNSLGLKRDPVNQAIVNTADLWSDDVIKKYLTMSQSFLVSVDIDNMFYSTKAIRSHNVPGKFTCYEDPVYPLLVGYGRAAEYWKSKEDGYWGISIADGYKQNYLLRTVKHKSLENMSDQSVPMAPFKYSRGCLLEIGGYNDSV